MAAAARPSQTTSDPGFEDPSSDKEGNVTLAALRDRIREHRLGLCRQSDCLGFHKDRPVEQCALCREPLNTKHHRARDGLVVTDTCGHSAAWACWVSSANRRYDDLTSQLLDLECRLCAGRGRSFFTLRLTTNGNSESTEAANVKTGMARLASAESQTKQRQRIAARLGSKSTQTASARSAMGGAAMPDEAECAFGDKCWRFLARKTFGTSSHCFFKHAGDDEDPIIVRTEPGTLRGLTWDSYPPRLDPAEPMLVSGPAQRKGGGKQTGAHPFKTLRQRAPRVPAGASTPRTSGRTGQSGKGAIGMRSWRGDAEAAGQSSDSDEADPRPDEPHKAPSHMPAGRVPMRSPRGAPDTAPAAASARGGPAAAASQSVSRPRSPPAAASGVSRASTADGAITAAMVERMVQAALGPLQARVAALEPLRDEVAALKRHVGFVWTATMTNGFLGHVARVVNQTRVVFLSCVAGVVGAAFAPVASDPGCPNSWKKGSVLVPLVHKSAAGPDQEEAARTVVALTRFVAEVRTVSLEETTTAAGSGVFGLNLTLGDSRIATSLRGHAKNKANFEKARKSKLADLARDPDASSSAQPLLRDIAIGEPVGELAGRFGFLGQARFLTCFADAKNRFSHGDDVAAGVYWREGSASDFADNLLLRVKELRGVAEQLGSGSAAVDVPAPAAAVAAAPAAASASARRDAAPKTCVRRLGNGTWVEVEVPTNEVLRIDNISSLLEWTEHALCLLRAHEPDDAGAADAPEEAVASAEA